MKSERKRSSSARRLAGDARKVSADTLASLVARHGHGPQVISYCPDCGDSGERTLVRCGEMLMPVGPYPYAGSKCLKHARPLSERAK